MHQASHSLPSGSVAPRLCPVWPADYFKCPLCMVSFCDLAPGDDGLSGGLPATAPCSWGSSGVSMPPPASPAGGSGLLLSLTKGLNLTAELASYSVTPHCRPPRKADPVSGCLSYTVYLLSCQFSFRESVCFSSKLWK